MKERGLTPEGLRGHHIPRIRGPMNKISSDGYSSIHLGWIEGK